MRTIDLAERLRAKRGSGGWIARCPAHDDRSPSLSIREGRDGRTVLHCFAGCEPSAIVNAAGLSLSDLFANERPRDFLAPARRLSADEIETELQRELERVVAEESAQLGFDVATISRHRNTARATIERRFDVQLQREPSPWYEAPTHALDPAWLLCVDAAVAVVAAHAGMYPRQLYRTIAHLPDAQHRADAQHRVLCLARRFQRELAPIGAILPVRRGAAA